MNQRRFYTVLVIILLATITMISGCGGSGGNATANMNVERVEREGI